MSNIALPKNLYGSKKEASHDNILSELHIQNKQIVQFNCELYAENNFNWPDVTPSMIQHIDWGKKFGGGYAPLFIYADNFGADVYYRSLMYNGLDVYSPYIKCRTAVPVNMLREYEMMRNFQVSTNEVVDGHYIMNQSFFWAACFMETGEKFLKRYDYAFAKRILF